MIWFLATVSVLNLFAYINTGNEIGYLKYWNERQQREIDELQKDQGFNK